jgi:rhodanese-related sulfurtransferase
MDQLIEFAMNHWILVGSFLLISALLLHNLMQSDKGSVDPLGAIEMINHQEALVIDVRPSADFQKGHIINAINAPSNGFANQINAFKKHKDHPVIVGCRSGAQSQVACQQLRKAGFEQVFNLKGGILAWQSANLPLTKKK